MHRKYPVLTLAALAVATPPDRRAHARKFAAIWTALAVILGVSFACEPAIARAGDALSFPDFDYQKECEKIGQPHPPRQGGDVVDTTMLINNCLDEEASSRKSAEYKWKLASENARTKAMAQVDYIRRDDGFYSGGRFYLYLDGSLSDFSRMEANDAANKRLHEKRPGVHY